MGSIPSVTDYGAVAGAPDNTQAIQNALNSAPEIYLPGGQWNTQPLTIPSTLRRLWGPGQLVGLAGPGSAFLSIADRGYSPFDLEEFSISLPSSFMWTEVVQWGQTALHARGVLVNGGRHSFIGTGANGSAVEECLMGGFTQSAVFLQNPNTVWVRNCEITGNLQGQGGHVIEVHGGSDVVLRDNSIYQATPGGFGTYFVGHSRGSITYTSSLGVILMGIGGDNNTWGTNLNNSVFQILEDSIANTLTTTASGGQLGPSNTLDLSANPPPAGPSAARYAALVFAGAITANQVVKVPNLTKWWRVRNATSGAFSVSIQTPSGTPVALPQNGGWQTVYCDGANTIVVWPFNTLGITMPNGSAAAPPYAFASESNSGWYRAGTQDLRLAVNGADVLQVTGAGAATPSVVNILGPNTLEIAGSSFGGFTTGDIKLTFKTAADPGWVLMNDSTIGDASSNASYANAAASALFTLFYNNIADADAPILTSGGGATTRGAQGSAATAFGNHCRLTLPLVLGRALAAAGAGAGLTARALGHAVGEETHTLVAGEIPAHTHGVNITSSGQSQSHVHGPGVRATNIWGSPGNADQTNIQSGAGIQVGQNSATGNANQDHTHNVIGNTDNGTGGGGAHNNIEPRTHLNVMIKL